MVDIQKTKLRIADNALFLQHDECTPIRDLPLIHLFNSWGSITYIFCHIQMESFSIFKEYKTMPKYFYDYSSDLFTLILCLFFRNNENLKSYIDFFFAGPYQEKPIKWKWPILRVTKHVFLHILGRSGLFDQVQTRIEFCKWQQLFCIKFRK